MTDGIEKFKEGLRIAGANNPQLLVEKLERVGLTKLELNIMKMRYIDGLLIKQMPKMLQVEERWVKKVHSRAIIKTLDGFNLLDLFELGIPIKVTLKTLYQI